jgi:hypothetical protein
VLASTIAIAVPAGTLPAVGGALGLVLSFLALGRRNVRTPA